MISKKIGRNDPCWCGSGKKYKKCHLNRESQQKINPWDASKAFKKAFSKQKCSCPDSFQDRCAAKIVNAHTVPKSSSLKAIAKDGHVYGSKFTFDQFVRNGGKIVPELVGINKASTFTGFCKIHDKEIFAPIEVSEFTTTPQQCFLLAYRALARECYAKSSMGDLNHYRNGLDKGKPLNAQIEIQETNSKIITGTNAALRDNKFHKECFDKCLETNDFSQVRALVFDFDAPPAVMASGAIFPDYNFDGNLIQYLGDLDRIMDLLSVTSFFDGKVGRVVFSWLENSHSSSENLVRSLLKKPHADIPALLVQYLYSNLENCYSSPTWWEGLSEQARTKIIDLQHDNASLYTEPNADGISTKLIDIDFPNLTNITAVNWHPDINLQS